jgi:hypothetical protein
MKSGKLNLLEPLGPVQACIGIAVPLPFTVQIESKCCILLVLIAHIISVLVSPWARISNRSVGFLLDVIRYYVASQLCHTC